MWCVVVCSVVYCSVVYCSMVDWWCWVMVVKVKVSGHNVEDQGRCDGVEKL